MEDYKQKYEQALGRAKALYAKGAPDSLHLEEIFPELKKSEDKRIRKELKSFFDSEMSDYGNVEWRKGIRYGEIVAWLEKQGKKVDAIENFNTEFERQISHLIASTINKEHEYNEDFVKWTANALLNYAKHELEKQGEQKSQGKSVLEVWKDMRLEVYQQASGNRHEPNYSDDSTKMFSLTDIDEIFEKVAEKQGEQKPAWNQKDEDMLKSIIATCKLAGQDRDSSSARHLFEMQTNWLKSLKERYTWKPSDEQIEALLKLEEMHVLEHEKTQENAHLYMVIKSLKEQLWKLKKGE